MEELWKLSAAEIALGIREGTFSASEVADSVLRRVDEKNPELNAITVEFPEQVHAAAAQADEALRNGEPLGPLHGVCLLYTSPSPRDS